MPDPTPLTRSEVVARQLTLDEGVRTELERLRQSGELGDCTKTEPRCYVCCEAESKELVNKLLAAGLTNREIAESCSHINARRQGNRDKRIIDAGCVYRHRLAHFNIDQPAQAVYREIVERRAEEANRDHVNGVGHAITPYAVLETIMTKGFSHLTDRYSTVTIKETMESAVRLHDMSAKDASQKKMADIMFKMDRILNAIFDVVPVEYHAQIMAAVDGQAVEQQIVEGVMAPVQKAMRELTPDRSGDEDDRF